MDHAPATSGDAISPPTDLTCWKSLKASGNWKDYRQSGASLSVDICGEIGEGFFSPPPSLKGCGAFACSLTHLFLSLKNPTLVTVTVGIKSLKRFFRT